MAKFAVMRESLYDPEIDQYVPTILWLKGPDGITVHGLPGSEARVAEYERALSDARARGITEEASWEYWATQGGHGQTEERTSPDIINGPRNIERLVRRELRRLRDVVV